MKGLYLKIVNAHGEPTKMRLAEFRINESSPSTDKLGIAIGKWLPITKEPEHEGTKFRFLKCLHCGHHDFNEDGERLCDYVCNGCGMTISANEKAA
ncbi:hypothetical protein KFE26_17980 [Shewanella sp. M16]|uniref:hypothetical protein n=1 Tax=Shewanella sp. M16 TaxID=2830837 RepID=UPI001BAE5B74|nr:hypothetical protein [Shewanella sp. M16]MBS0044175.1 hypothetical protein [Shewanella sp. M16]